MTKSLTNRIREYLRKPIAVAGLAALLSFGGRELYSEGSKDIPDTYSRFIRGDVNRDRKVDIDDAIHTLDYLFRGREKLKCMDAADVNDDGKINISDPVYLLMHLFDDKLIPQPYPELGRDETEDDLSCFPWSPWAMFGYDPQHSGKSPHIGTQTPDLKWTFSTGGSIRSTPAIDRNGNIYITSQDGYLYCIRPNSDLKWKYLVSSHLPSLWGGYSSAISPDGNIYINTDDLYAFNPDGSIKWKFPLGNRQTRNSPSSSPTIAYDGIIYVGSNIGPYEGYLYAINPDGSLKWKSSSTKYGILTSPAIGQDGTIYIGDGETIYAFSSNGRLKWTCESRSSIESSFSIGPNGTIYYTGENRALFAVSKDGYVKWEGHGCIHIPGIGCEFSGMPAIEEDGTLYLGGHKYLSCINPDGTLKWSFEVEWNVSPPAIDREGTVYFGVAGSSNHYIYAVNPDGTLKWRYKTELGVEGYPAIGSDGNIYIGSEDGKLYAIGQ